MADFERKLTNLAERGTRVGAEEMIERVEAQIAEDPLVVVTKQRKGRGMSVQTDDKQERKQRGAGSGVVWAAAAFVAVIGVTALFVVFSEEPESDVIEPAQPTVTTETTVDDEAVAAVTQAYASLPPVMWMSTSMHSPVRSVRAQ